jgi:tetratricopeptide (TPR) repeat protein
VATSLTNLAMVYGAQGRCAEAEPLYQRALAIDERALRSDHPTVTTRLNNLAALYDSQGRYAQGEPLYRRALAIVEQALGPEHPLAARSLNNLVNLLEQSQPSHARQLYQRARRIFLRVAQVNIDLHDEALRGLLRESQQALQANMAFLARLARQSQSTPKAMSPAWEAFEVAEQLRGGAAHMALAQAGARAATGSPTTAQLARQGQDMRQQWRAVRTQLTAEYGKSAPQRNATRVAQLQQDERQLDDALAAATRRLRTVFPQYAALLMPEPIELAAVAALLQPHEALVSFFTLPDRLLVWLVRPNIQAEVAVIDASNMIVMPGFVDTHRHIWEGILRSILPNGLLSDYLRDITGAARAVYRPEDAYAGNLVSTLGAINAGITTLLDWSHIGNSPEHTDAAIAALQDAGIRAVYAYGGGIAGPANKFPQDIHRLRAQYFSSADQLLTLARATGINAAHWAVAREVGASPSMPTAQTNCSRWRRP